MVGDWNKLGQDWDGHAFGLVADIDCADEAAVPICEDYEIDAFPSLMYGDLESPEFYEGEPTYEAMSVFAKEHLSTPKCTMKRQGTCTEEEKAIITEMLSKSKEELVEMEEKIFARVDEEDDEFQKIVEAMNAEFDAMEESLQSKSEEEVEQIMMEMDERFEVQTKQFNAKIDAIRAETNFKWIQQAINLKEEEEEEEEL